MGTGRAAQRAQHLRVEDLPHKAKHGGATVPRVLALHFCHAHLLLLRWGPWGLEWHTVEEGRVREAWAEGKKVATEKSRKFVEKHVRFKCVRRAVSQRLSACHHQRASSLHVSKHVFSTQYKSLCS